MRWVVNVTVGCAAVAVVLMVGLIGAGTVGLAGQAGGTITAGISPSSGPPGYIHHRRLGQLCRQHRRGLA